jgi:signal transduction histidine kinase
MLPTDPLDSEPQAIERAKVLRRILLASFGGLLALMIVAGVSSLRLLRQLDTIEQEVNRRFSSRGQALSAIVISVHVYSDQMERFLLQDGQAKNNSSAAEVTSHGTDLHAALNSYPAPREPEEQFLIQEIEQECAKEEASFSQVIRWRAPYRHQRAEQYISEQIIPRRTHILEVTRDISTLNGRRLVEENQVLATKFQDLQARLMTMIVLSPIAGLLLSVLAGGYILRLEKQGHLRYEALAHSRHELEGLSARLVEAQEKERQAISRELHDEVGQTLGALLVDLGQLAKLVSQDDVSIQGQISRIKSAAESAVKSIRDMALLLRPPMLDDLGLIPALEWQAREISRRGNMEVEVHSERISEDLSDETKVCIYRIAQEALNNAATHAGAKDARVSVVQDAENITLEINDDGHGFNADRVRGMGILGMEERVKRLGGSFSINSAPGSGTTVRVTLSVPSTHVL